MRALGAPMKAQIFLSLAAVDAVCFTYMHNENNRQPDALQNTSLSAMNHGHICVDGDIEEFYRWRRLCAAKIQVPKR